jgi:hypothetical protein
MAPLSVTCLRPRFSMTLVGGAFTAGHGLEARYLGDFAGDGVVLDALQHAAQLLGADRDFVDVQALLVQAGCPARP